MIESALARIAVRAAVEPMDPGESEPFASDRLPAAKREHVPANQLSSSRATNGKNLQEAIERMERRLGGAREVAKTQNFADRAAGDADA